VDLDEIGYNHSGYSGDAYLFWLGTGGVIAIIQICSPFASKHPG